ncbi:MAG: putative DNA-binding domain-containing protein, partial [Burkholderiales bacterium]
IKALLTPGAPLSPAIAALAAQPGFAVYRNTVMKGCVDALQSNYPSVTRLVGEEWFRAAAAVFVRRYPPEQPTLLHYGEGFAEFLIGFQPAASLPYLPGVARLDRLWTEAYAAADKAPLDPAALAGLQPEALAESRLRPHAATRWAWFDEQPIYTIWSRNREGIDVDEIEWRGEGCLLTRPRDTVQWMALGKAGWTFLNACDQNHTLAEAAGAALAAWPEADIARILAELMAAGALCQLEKSE